MFRPQGSGPDSSGIPVKKGPLRKIGVYTVWNGKFGLFVSKEAKGKKGARAATGSLDKDCDVALLTEEMCEAAIKKQRERKGTKWTKGKKGKT